MIALAVLLSLFVPSSQQWIYRPDLSNELSSAPAPAEAFARIDYFYLQPGKLAEAEALARRHAEVDRDVGVRHAREIYVAADASAEPHMMQIVRARSRSEYEANRKAAEARRGERIRAVYAAESGVVRRIVSLDAFLLPGAKGLVTLDYLALDPSTGRVWVPAGNTGNVDVIDGPSLKSIRGFATRAFELKGHGGFLGPSSIAIGDGRAYIGNRADATICAIDAQTLKREKCAAIAKTTEGWAAAPDAVVFVPTTHELWITRGAPPLGIPSADRAITILDARTLTVKSKLPLDGSAEGYALDASRGVFFTNLEETAETIAIDVRSHAIVSRWRSGCSEPHGVAFDEKRQLLFVACDDRIHALDTAHGGRVTDTLATGAGVDNIDFAGHRVYVAASVAATLTVARVADDGTFHDPMTFPTAKSARVVIAGSDGAAYVADPAGGVIFRIEVSK